MHGGASIRIGRIAAGSIGRIAAGSIGRMAAASAVSRPVESGVEPQAANAYLAIATNRETTVSALSRFLGDSPLRVLVKLIVVSFLVGLVMSAFGWSPFDVVYHVQRFFLDIWHMGFHAVDRLGSYILLAAAIVVPVFLLMRIASYRP